MGGDFFDGIERIGFMGGIICKVKMLDKRFHFFYNSFIR